MNNLALISALTEQKRRQCPCGAVANPLTGLCRKCHARNAWRRKTISDGRKTARPRHTRRTRTRNVARFLADVLNLLTIITNGMEG